MSEILDLIDINKKKGFPREYKFNQFIRWFTILLAVFAILYSLYVLFFHITAQSSTFKKAVPFIILFLGINSLLKNLFTLNKIVFTENEVIFKFLAKKSVHIPYNSIKKMASPKTRQSVIRIEYLENGENKIFDFVFTIPNMLEIINSIAEMNEDIEYDQFLQSIIITKQEKNLMKLRPVNFKKDSDNDS